MKSLLLVVALLGIAHADKFPPSGPCDDIDACEKACKANTKGSCYWGGVLVLQAPFDEANRPRALAMFDKACAKGDADGCWQSANIQWHIDSKELKTAGPKTHAAFQKACTKNHARACMRLADIVASDEGNAKSQKQAASLRAKGVKLLEGKCNAKMARACSWVADMYESGLDGVTLNPKKAQAFKDKRCVIETGKKCAPPPPPPPPPQVPVQESRPHTKPAIRE